MRSRLTLVCLVALPLCACIPQHSRLSQPSPSMQTRAAGTAAPASGNGVPSPGQAFLIALGIGLIVGVIVLLGGGKSQGQ